MYSLPHCQQSPVKNQHTSWIIHRWQVLLSTLPGIVLKPIVLTVKPRQQPGEEAGRLVFFQRCCLMEQTFTLFLSSADSHLVFCCFDLLFGRPSLLFIFLYIQRCMWATWHCVIRWFLFWLSCVGEFSNFPQTGARWRDDTGSEDSLQPVI